jgi:aldehyde:ferredoxin oxidoreductase
MHDLRGMVGVGMSYAISQTGADHVRAPYDTPFPAPGPMMGRIVPLGLIEPIPSRELGPRKARTFT